MRSRRAASSIVNIAGRSSSDPSSSTAVRIRMSSLHRCHSRCNPRKPKSHNGSGRTGTYRHQTRLSDTDGHKSNIGCDKITSRRPVLEGSRTPISPHENATVRAPAAAAQSAVTTRARFNRETDALPNCCPSDVRRTRFAPATTGAADNSARLIVPSPKRLPIGRRWTTMVSLLRYGGVEVAPEEPATSERMIAEAGAHALLGCNLLLSGASLRMSVAVAAGSAPGEPSGRWVAGCCASRVDFDEFDQVLNTVEHRSTGADGPHDCVNRPQKRLLMAWPMVVRESCPVTDRMIDSAPVPQRLHGFLVVEHPVGDRVRFQHSACGAEEQLSSSYSVHPGRTAKAEHNRNDVKPADRIEQQSPAPRRLLGRVDSSLAGHQQRA